MKQQMDAQGTGGPGQARLASWGLCLQRTEYDRLKDAKGKPPGLMGWWPSRSVTFLENHDTVRARAAVFSVPGFQTTRGTQLLFEEGCHPSCYQILLHKQVNSTRVYQSRATHGKRSMLQTNRSWCPSALFAAVLVAAGPLDLRQHP